MGTGCQTQPKGRWDFLHLNILRKWMKIEPTKTMQGDCSVYYIWYSMFGDFEPLVTFQLRVIKYTHCFSFIRVLKSFVRSSLARSYVKTHDVIKKDLGVTVQTLLQFHEHVHRINQFNLPFFSFVKKKVPSWISVFFFIFIQYRFWAKKGREKMTI